MKKIETDILDNLENDGLFALSILGNNFPALVVNYNPNKIAKKNKKIKENDVLINFDNSILSKIGDITTEFAISKDEIDSFIKLFKALTTILELKKENINDDVVKKIVLLNS